MLFNLIHLYHSWLIMVSRHSVVNRAETLKILCVHFNTHRWFERKPVFCVPESYWLKICSLSPRLLVPAIISMFSLVQEVAVVIHLSSTIKLCVSRPSFASTTIETKMEVNIPQGSEAGKAGPNGNKLPGSLLGEILEFLVVCPNNFQ